MLERQQVELERTGLEPESADYNQLTMQQLQEPALSLEATQMRLAERTQSVMHRPTGANSSVACQCARVLNALRVSAASGQA